MDDFAPDTPEGAASWRACQSEGVWRYSGVVSAHGGSVICTGLDFMAALALADPDRALRREVVMACLKAIETGRLTGQARAAERGAN